MIIVNYGSFAFAGNTSEFVLTITAPVSEGVNGSKVLFKKLKQMIGDETKNDTFASIIDKVGGNWSLTSEMSCVQLAILFPQENASIVEGIYNFVSKISQLKLSIGRNGDRSAFSAIFANCATKCDWNWNEPISFYSNGLPESFSDGLITILASSTYESDLFYSDKEWRNSLSVKNNYPMSSLIYSWDKISINNYISAKIIGEKFLKAFSETEFTEYRIWTLPGKLFLVLSIKASEQVLFNNLQNSSNFCNSIKNSKIGKSDEWKSFAASSKRILTEDRRDTMKTALFNGWRRHWTNGNEEAPSEINFVAPNKCESVFVMPKASRHEVSYSNNEAIRFVGHTYKESKELIDVVLAIQSQKLPSIKKAFDNAADLVVPVTLKEVKENLLLVAFCADTSTIDAMTKSLSDKVSRMKLSSDSSISLAAVGRFAPFILKYRLKTNWKSVEKKSSWQEVNEEDIANALGVSIKDRIALRGKYQLKIASSRGRAELLATLSCQNKKLSNFTALFK